MMQLNRRRVVSSIAAALGIFSAARRRADASCSSDGMGTFTSGLCSDVSYSTTGVNSSWDLGSGAISASISIRYYDKNGNVSYNDSASLSNLGGGFDISFNAPPRGVDWSGGFDMVGSEFSGGGSAGDGSAYTLPCF